MAATALRVRTQPQGGVSGSAFTTQPVVIAVDASGAIDTSFTGNVTASLFAGGASLSGTATVAAVAGVATFTNLTLTGTGNNANGVLAFAASGLAGCISGQAILFLADSTGPNGGAVPRSFDEGDYLDASGGDQVTTPFAEASWITTATACDVYWLAFHGSFSGSGCIAIYVDGVHHITLDSGDVDGDQTDLAVALPAGTKAVTFVNGATNGSPGGSVLNEVVFNAAATRVPPSTPAVRVVGVGDSIMVASGASAPAETGYMMLLRAQLRPRSVFNTALAGRSFYNIATNPTQAEAAASGLKKYGPTHLIFGLLANDAIGDPWGGAANYQAALEAYLDQINADMPLCKVVCLSTFDTGGTYPTAMGAACSGRAWVTYLDMQSILSSGDYTDGLHPDDSGHAKIAAALGAALELPEAGVRSLFAPWLGGVSASPDQAGMRSLLAPWIGGGSADGASPIVVSCGVARAKARAVVATPVLGAVTPAAAPARARARSVPAQRTLGATTASCATARAKGRSRAAAAVLGALSVNTAPARSRGRGVACTVTMGAITSTVVPARARGRGVASSTTLGSVSAAAGVARARATALPALTVTGFVVSCGTAGARARSVPATITLGAITAPAGVATARAAARPSTPVLGPVASTTAPAVAEGTARAAVVSLGPVTPSTAPARAIGRAIPTLPLSPGAWVFACGVGRAAARANGATVGIGIISPAVGSARARARGVGVYTETPIIISRVFRATIYGGHVLGVAVHGGHAFDVFIDGGD